MGNSLQVMTVLLCIFSKECFESPFPIIEISKSEIACTLMLNNNLTVR